MNRRLLQHIAEQLPPWCQIKKIEINVKVITNERCFDFPDRIENNIRVTQFVDEKNEHKKEPHSWNVGKNFFLDMEALE